MKTRRQHAAKDALTISRRPPTSIENSETTIPYDVIIEILLRLPAKSIAKCRCVCKRWASILRRSDFTELFMTRSRALPKILLSCRESGEFFFFSIPQIQNEDRVAANYHMRFPCEFYSKIIGPVRGLVCLTHPRKYKKTSPVMCNPSTGQSLPLPNVKTRSLMVNTFLGFDPIDKQFKLLSMTNREDSDNCKEYQVLTIGTKKKISWRMIECPISHHFLHKMYGICINGVIYYGAGINTTPRAIGVVCFDVRSEKFRVVNRAEDMALWSDSTLVNYKGQLGALLTEGVAEVTGKTECFELWVLVDAEKHEWSKLISVSLPTLWKNIVAKAELYFVGVTDTDDMVLAPHYVSHDTFCYYVYYYSIQSNTIRRVEIQGMDAFKYVRVHISLNHVEDVQLLQYV